VEARPALVLRVVASVSLFVLIAIIVLGLNP
jgi:hypothetical protein